MKAVIVFDVDSDFDFDQKLWVQIEEYLDGEILESGCHDVRPLPEPKDIGYPNEDYDVGFGDGWDACLKEIQK